MTEYAYSRKEPCISSTTSMSRMRSSNESSGGGVFVLRRAIAAGSSFLVARLRVAHGPFGSRLLKHERDLTPPLWTAALTTRARTRCGRSGPPVRAPSGAAARRLRDPLWAYVVRELRRGSARLHTVAGPAAKPRCQPPHRRSKGRTCPWV